MNSSEQPHKLSQVLEAWRVSPVGDPNFRPAVWQRIKQHSRETWAAYVRTHLAAWALVAGVSVVAATWAGHTAARSKLDASREQMVVNYLGELDPRVLAKLHPSP